MINLLGRAFTGARHLRPSLRAKATFFTGVVAGLFMFTAVLQRYIVHKPAPGRTLASALEYIPSNATPFRDALDVTWRREMALTGNLRNLGTAFLVARAPPALCPSGSGPMYAGPDSERLRHLVNALDAALRSGNGRGEVARQALASLDAARLVGGYPLAKFIQDYNLARGGLLNGDSAWARRLLAPYFADSAANPLRESSLDTERATFLFHARMVAGLAALGLRDTVAIVHFRGGIRMLRVLAPYSRSALASDESLSAFVVDPGAARCEGTVESALSNSMDAWAGSVAAYRQASGFADTQNLAWELADLGDDRTDPLYPLLRHGVQVANGRPSPVPANFLWAASNLRRVYAANRRGPDSRLEAARTVLLLDLVDNDAWMQAVRTTSRTLDPAQAMDRCAILERLARDLEATSPRNAGNTSFTDSLRAALAVNVHARRHGCAGAAEPVDDALRSDWIRLGTRMLGDSLSAHVEEWRLAIREREEGSQRKVDETIQRSQNLQAVLTPPIAVRLAARGDTTYRFVAHWRQALFAEVFDTLRARSTINQLNSGEGNRVPAVMLGLALHACDRPRECFTPANIDAVLGGQPPLAVRMRYFTGNHPVLFISVLVLLAAASLGVGVRWYFWTWRRRMFVYGRFYHSEQW
jgi:hypothetical protein